MRAQTLTHPTFDWIQISVKCSPSWLKEIPPCYIVKERAQGTKMFKSVIDIYSGSHEVATIAHSPRSNILPKQFALVKYNNQYLYQGNIDAIIKQTIYDWKLEFMGNNRLDICIDFNIFKNNLLPATFIKGFINSLYIRNGQTNFSIYGKQRINTQLQTFGFGSEQSPVSVKLYNKTLEQKVKVFKPWIKRHWDIYKIDQSSDIWRLEFSLKTSTKNLLNIDTGECSNIYRLHEYTKNIREIIFYSCLNKYFSFVRNNGKGRKDRMRELKLFIYKIPNYKMIELQNIYTSNRMHKWFLKELQGLNREIRDNKIDPKRYIEETIEYFRDTRLI